MFLIIFYVLVYIFSDITGTFYTNLEISLFKKLNIMDMDSSVVIEGMEGDV